MPKEIGYPLKIPKKDMKLGGAIKRKLTNVERIGKPAGERRYAV